MDHAALIWTDWREPADVLAGFADEPFALGFLAGASGWSYLARAPIETFELAPDADPQGFVDFCTIAGSALAEGPPFQGGVAGLATYEFATRLEPVALRRRAGWPDLVCGRYASLLAFDPAGRRLCAIGRGDTDDQAQARAREALGWLDYAAAPAVAGRLAEAFASDDGPAYEAAVADVRRRILAGEIFQANIARAWRGRLHAGVRPFDVTARLAKQSPAPHAAYFNLGDRVVVSNTPERFLRTQDGQVESRPIKGTAPRGSDAATDAALAEGLAASLKDRAENLMIVDLMRNDLARVCQPGSVAAPELFRIETYPNVHHLVSVVTGRLARGQGAADLMLASFPPGSITGAPKVQALKVIAGHEGERGPYCGSMFWLGADGAFDSSVLIRTLACERDGEGWRIEGRAGAGIVADSDPVAERLETEAKIAAIARALLEDGG